MSGVRKEPGLYWMRSAEGSKQRSPLHYLPAHSARLASTRSRWKKLTGFLEYPELELSTNPAENSMRPVALGRNYVHSRIMCTPEGKKCMIPQIDGLFSQEALPCHCAYKEDVLLWTLCLSTQMRAVHGWRDSRDWPTAHNPGVNIIPSIEIFRYSEELDTHRQFTGRAEDCGDSVDRGKLPQAKTRSARLSGCGSSRARRSPDSAPPGAYSRCVGHPGIVGRSAVRKRLPD